MSGTRPKGPNSARRRQIKRQVAKRDGAACFYCTRPFADLAEATLDHLVPYSALPTWVQANLVLACRPCNEAKADRLPQEFLKPAVPFHPGLRPRPEAGTVPDAVPAPSLPKGHRMTLHPDPEEPAAFPAGWWLTTDQICAELRIPLEDWQMWHADGQAPPQITGPDGIDRVHRADFEAWLDWCRFDANGTDHP